MKDYRKGIKILSTSAIVLYLMFLVWGLFFKFGDIEYTRKCSYGLSLLTTKERLLYDIIPFDFGNTEQKMIHFMLNILNMLVFIPLAVVLIFRSGKIKPVKHALFCFIVSLIFEVSQFFTLIGGFASDDLLMNTMGYFAGALLYYVLFRRLSDKINFYLLLIFNVILVPTFIYSFFNIIPIFDQYVGIVKDFAMK